MTTNNFTTPPAWITNPDSLQDAILHSSYFTSDVTKYIIPVHHDTFSTGFRQFLFWHRHFQPSVTNKTLMFALMGPQGLDNIDVTNVIEAMSKVGPINHAIEFHQGPNTKFMAISFPQPSDVAIFQKSFLYFNNSIVSYVQTHSIRSINFSLLWLPPLFESDYINSFLRKFFASYSYSKGAVKIGHGAYLTSSLVKGSCTLRPDINLADIPDLIRLPSPHNGSALLILDNRDPLCLKCMLRGHVRKFCTATKCTICRSFHPNSAICPPKSYSAVTATTPASNPFECWPEDLESSHIIDDPQPTHSSSPHLNLDRANLTTSHTVPPTNLLKPPPPPHTSAGIAHLAHSAPLIPPSFIPNFISPNVAQPSPECISESPLSPLTSEFAESFPLLESPSSPLDTPQPPPLPSSSSGNTSSQDIDIHDSATPSSSNPTSPAHLKKKHNRKLKSTSKSQITSPSHPIDSPEAIEPASTPLSPPRASRSLPSSQHSSRNSSPNNSHPSGFDSILPSSYKRKNSSPPESIDHIHNPNKYHGRSQQKKRITITTSLTDDLHILD